MGDIMCAITRQRRWRIRIAVCRAFCKRPGVGRGARVPSTILFDILLRCPKIVSFANKLPKITTIIRIFDNARDLDRAVGTLARPVSKTRVR
jgi:hypothetical protein